MAGVGVYAASKRGLRAAFDALRLELAPAGVNTSCVMPGMFETEGLTIEGMAFDGDVPPDDIPWFAPDSGPASAVDLADTIAFMISRPEGFCINELVARPTGQLNP
jgi:NADP-dependent 3-hydroxy acid dehydrogenase YdfG